MCLDLPIALAHRLEAHPFLGRLGAPRGAASLLLHQDEAVTFRRRLFTESFLFLYMSQFNDEQTLARPLRLLAISLGLVPGS